MMLYMSRCAYLSKDVVWQVRTHCLACRLRNVRWCNNEFYEWWTKRNYICCSDFINGNKL